MTNIHYIDNSVDIYTYFDLKTMDQICQVRRTQEKKITQWTLEKDKWVPKGLPQTSLRPIYNVLDLISKPTAPILFVEGEKTCEAAKILFPDMVCLTWLGGSSVSSKVDLSHFINKDIYLWPDFDLPGIKAMDTIGKRLIKETDCRVYLVELDDDIVSFPKGWDVADKLPDKAQDLRDYIATAKRFTLASLEKSSKGVYFPDVSSKNNNLNTIANLESLLAHYNISIKKNEMTHKKEFSGLDCHSADYAANIKSLCSLHSLPASRIDEYIDVISNKNKFHPAVEWIQSKKWDGIDRFNDLLNTLGTDDDLNLVKELIYRWMLGALEAAYSDKGVQMPGALVLQGAPGLGKTYWMLRLAPYPLTIEGKSLNADNKDSIIQATSNWIVELGEIATTYKMSDINSLKNFITRGYDAYRRAYRADEEEVPRRTVYFGSVNEQTYLVDKTGNRRWWSIGVTRVDSYHTIDMQQLWAQLALDYHKGERCVLSPEFNALLNENNKKFESQDFLYDIISSRYDWNCSPDSYRKMMANEILKELFPGEGPTFYSSMYKKLSMILQGNFKLTMKRSKSGCFYLIPKLLSYI